VEEKLRGGGLPPSYDAQVLGGDVLRHVGVEVEVKCQPKRKETKPWWRSPWRRKAMALLHDSDSTAVPGGRRRLNCSQGEAKGAAMSSFEGGSSHGGGKR
jgi:hypothetical protein